MCPEVERWISAIDVLKSLHQMKDQYKNREFSSVDAHRNHIINVTKELLSQVVKLTGVSKAFAQKYQSKEKDKLKAIHDENTAIGSAAVRLTTHCMLAVKAPYDTASQQQHSLAASALSEAVTKLEPLIGGSNQSAIESASKLFKEQADKLALMPPPSVKKEIDTSIENIRLELERLIDSTAEKRSDLSKRVGQLGDDFLLSTKEIGASIVDTTLRSSLLNLATEVPKLLTTLREQIKSATYFQDESLFSEQQKSKYQLESVFESLIKLGEQL